MSVSHDVICIGGGVIGLMTARELHARGLSVCVVDRSDLASESSWAGAGIVPPPGDGPKTSPLDHLRAESFHAFSTLAESLLNATGIDIGLRRTGGIELAASDEDVRELSELSNLWREMGIRFERMEDGLSAFEPRLAEGVRSAYHFPDLCQVRNPRLTKGLVQDLSRRKVTLLPREEVVEFHVEGSRVTGVGLASGRTLHASDTVVAAGAWSGALLRKLGIPIPVRPVQGQIVAFQTEPGSVRKVVLLGKHYFVPREDGLLLVGSTEDDVGFAKQVTEAGLSSLRAFAYRWFPFLRDCEVRAAWAGLRPGNALGHPILCRAPSWTNLWLGTGHFRQGIQLAAGSAQLLADWITQRRTFAEPDDFGLDTKPIRQRIPFRS